MSMSVSIPLTEAKAKFSELISRIRYKGEKFYISRKGKTVAALVPPDELKGTEKGGLIKAQRGLADLDDAVDEMETLIYKARETDFTREVDL